MRQKAFLRRSAVCSVVCSAACAIALAMPHPPKALAFSSDGPPAGVLKVDGYGATQRVNGWHKYTWVGPDCQARSAWGSVGHSFTEKPYLVEPGRRTIRISLLFAQRPSHLALKVWHHINSRYHPKGSPTRPHFTLRQRAHYPEYEHHGAVWVVRFHRHVRAGVNEYVELDATWRDHKCYATGWAPYMFRVLGAK